MYYIYEYIDPRTNLPFYIGKGKDTRMYDHIRTAQSKRENPDKAKVIEDIISAGLYPIIREIESNIPIEADAYIREDYYIRLYGRKGFDAGGILTNKQLYAQPPTPVWDDAKKKQHSEWNSKYWTEEKRLAHKELVKENSIKGGLASRGTVSVVDLNGQCTRIPQNEYILIDRNKPISEQEFVSTASKEGKRRLNDLTLGTVVVTGASAQASGQLDCTPRVCAG